MSLTVERVGQHTVSWSWPPGKNGSNEVFQAIFCVIKCVVSKRNKHGCFIRVSECSIRVSWFFLQSIGQKWDQAWQYCPHPCLYYLCTLHITVFLGILLNWSIDRRYMCVKQYTKYLYCCNTWWRAHPNFKLTILKNISCNYKDTKFYMIWDILFWVIKD